MLLRQFHLYESDTNFCTDPIYKISLICEKQFIITIKYLLNYLHESNYEQNGRIKYTAARDLAHFQFFIFTIFYFIVIDVNISFQFLCLSLRYLLRFFLSRFFNVLLHLIHFKRHPYFVQCIIIVRNYPIQHYLKGCPKNIYHKNIFKMLFEGLRSKGHFQ